MSRFDTLITNGLIITAADRYTADIGLKDGRIVALGQDLGEAEEVIDAEGLWVMPGGVDAHCHLDQPLGDGAVMADDFLTGTRSAADALAETIYGFFHGEGCRARRRTGPVRPEGR